VLFSISFDISVIITHFLVTPYSCKSIMCAKDLVPLSYLPPRKLCHLLKVPAAYSECNSTCFCSNSTDISACSPPSCTKCVNTRVTVSSTSAASTTDAAWPRQYLYFCISKASKLISCVLFRVALLLERELMVILYICMYVYIIYTHTYTHIHTHTHTHTHTHRSVTERCCWRES
jgi:hypothetical protein